MDRAGHVGEASPSGVTEDHLEVRPPAGRTGRPVQRLLRHAVPTRDDLAAHEPLHPSHRGRHAGNPRPGQRVRYAA